MVAVVLVTAGVIWATLDNANSGSQNVKRTIVQSNLRPFNKLFFSTKSDEASMGEFMTGIMILVIAMILSAGMGLIQEVTYKKYGKQWREGLFYTVNK